jgi:hypothetical protein
MLDAGWVLFNFFSLLLFSPQDLKHIFSNILYNLKIPSSANIDRRIFVIVSLELIVENTPAVLFFTSKSKFPGEGCYLYSISWAHPFNVKFFCVQNWWYPRMPTSTTPSVRPTTWTLCYVAGEPAAAWPRADWGRPRRRSGRGAGGAGTPAKPVASCSAWRSSIHPYSHYSITMLFVSKLYSYCFQKFYIRIIKYFLFFHIFFSPSSSSIVLSVAKRAM